MSFSPGALVWFQVERGVWKPATVSNLTSCDDLVQIIDDQGRSLSCKAVDCFLQNTHTHKTEACTVLPCSLIIFSIHRFLLHFIRHQIT